MLRRRTETQTWTPSLDRRECPPPDDDGARRCPRFACRYHLWPDWQRAAIAKREPAPHLGDLCGLTCALDAANVGPHSLATTGAILGGLSRERIRQIEAAALNKLRTTHPELAELLGATFIHTDEEAPVASVAYHLRPKIHPGRAEPVARAILAAIITKKISRRSVADALEISDTTVGRCIKPLSIRNVSLTFIHRILAHLGLPETMTEPDYVDGEEEEGAVVAEVPVRPGAPAPLIITDPPEHWGRMWFSRRAANGWTMVEATHSIGICTKTLRRIERSGEMTGSEDTLHRLGRAYSITLPDWAWEETRARRRRVMTGGISIRRPEAGTADAQETPPETEAPSAPAPVEDPMEETSLEPATVVGNPPPIEVTTRPEPQFLGTVEPAPQNVVSITRRTPARPSLEDVITKALISTTDRPGRERERASLIVSMVRYEGLLGESAPLLRHQFSAEMDRG